MQQSFKVTIFDREYVVRRGLRIDFVVVVVVVVVGDHQELLCQIYLKQFSVVSGRGSKRCN